MTYDASAPMVLAYHPELDTTCPVPADAMMHHRLSGWMLWSEYQEQQQQKAQQEEDAKKSAPASRPAASKSASASDKDG